MFFASTLSWPLSLDRRLVLKGCLVKRFPGMRSTGRLRFMVERVLSLIDLVEKTICCLGQTNVTINYQRRTSALVKVTRDPSKDKSVLRNKHDILAKSEGGCRCYIIAHVHCHPSLGLSQNCY
jgi:hypothetical protein